MWVQRERTRAGPSLKLKESSLKERSLQVGLFLTLMVQEDFEIGGQRWWSRRRQLSGLRGQQSLNQRRREATTDGSELALLCGDSLLLPHEKLLLLLLQSQQLIEANRIVRSQRVLTSGRSQPQELGQFGFLFHHAGDPHNAHKAGVIFLGTVLATVVVFLGHN